jgi:hypothetical protein
MAGQAARTKPPRPPQTPDYGTGPVVLVLEVALLSWLALPLTALLGDLGAFGDALAANYFLVGVAVVVFTALGMWIRRRMRAKPVRRGRSKVIPFPEHRRRRGA